MRRWLPVGSGQTSPDGSSYAYSVSGESSSDSTQVHVVTVATGADHVLTVNPPLQGAAVGWAVGDYDGRYVYLLGEQVENFPGGVWRLNATTGSIDQVSQVPEILLLQGGYAWVGTVNPADPSPPLPPRSGRGFDSIVQVNLSTGARTTWIYRTGDDISLVGLDHAGHPIVSIAPGPDYDVSHGTELLVTTPGGAGTQISSGALSLFQMQPDVGRIWFGTGAGIYMWTAAAGVQKMFAFPGSPTNGQSIMPAGHCV